MNDSPWVHELVEELTKLADPHNPRRAVMAHLRHGLDRPVDYVLSRVGWLFRRVPDWALEEGLLAAGLFAWVKGNCPQRANVNFGKAFGANLTLDQKQQREKRFIDLLDTDKEELPYKLRQAIALIGKDGIGLDWPLLIRHLGKWDHPDHWVQKDWARGFWSAPLEEEPTTLQAETSVP